MGKIWLHTRRVKRKTSLATEAAKIYQFRFQHEITSQEAQIVFRGGLALALDIRRATWKIGGFLPPWIFQWQKKGPMKRREGGDQVADENVERGKLILMCRQQVTQSKEGRRGRSKEASRRLRGRGEEGGKTLFSPQLPQEVGASQFQKRA